MFDICVQSSAFRTVAKYQSRTIKNASEHISQGRRRTSPMLAKVMLLFDLGIVLKITANVRQPWTDLHDRCFEYLIIRFYYLIIPFEEENKLEPINKKRISKKKIN